MGVKGKTATVTPYQTNVNSNMFLFINVFPHHAWLTAYLIEPEKDSHQEEHADTDDERGCHAGLYKLIKFHDTLKRSFFMWRRISAFCLYSNFSGQDFP
jgi:hypothetical protein